MRWRGRRESDNVEDRRSDEADAGFSFPTGRSGGGFRIPIGGRKGGIGGIWLLVIVGVLWLFGINPLDLLQGMQSGGSPGNFPNIQLPRSQAPKSPGGEATRPQAQHGDDMKAFVSVVLADTEDVWTKMFQSFGKTYTKPTLVIYSGVTRTACGTGQSAMGPFYCPGDQKVYIDLDFYQELRRRFGAPGDFAQAYVIAHEIGHHVQTLLGISDKVQQAKQGMDQRGQNALQVRMELQADCFAGVWANHAQETKQILEPGDVDEALHAASAIGDDNIQRQTQGRVVPDAFTHGSSDQRVHWFKTGFQSGQIQDCDTFNAESL